jgi:hypothetical protein
MVKVEVQVDLKEEEEEQLIHSLANRKPSSSELLQ